MSGCFGEAAARLCGLVSPLLGWRPDEFWSSTPVELATVLTPPSAGAEPLQLDAFADLRRQFPDD